jgi:preprotein translocase subunit SecG
MLAIISILIFICCCLLVLAVLIQNPKGGGLASGFQSGSQVMGVRRTADFLEKATWTLAVAILLLSVVSTTMNKTASAGGTETESSATKDKATELETQPATNNAVPPLGTTPPPAAQPAPGVK